MKGFTPGTLLEISYSSSERHVVMVCMDGITFDDGANLDVPSPAVIHHSMNPKPLGTFFGWVCKQGLQDALDKAIEFLGNNGRDDLVNEFLFLPRLMRKLEENPEVRKDPQACLPEAFQTAMADRELLRKHEEWGRRFHALLRAEKEAVFGASPNKKAKYEKRASTKPDMNEFSNSM